MKKLLAVATTGLGFTSNAFAGVVGFSTIQINWSAGAAASAQPVPTLGTYGAIMLAILLALAAYRLSRKGGALVRAAAPLATLGLAAGLLFSTDNPIAGIAMVPAIEGNSSEGSQSYTANEFDPPPCFINNSGQPVTVTYTFVDGAGPGGEPITAETCTFDYYCQDGEGEGEPNVALDGASVPSDGQPYATAYCSEIFGEGPGGEGNQPG
ncbi:hypothetical protein DWB85_09800 [Seongchinamella sediminis]|uniref:Uncharacterized protein n=1 Tax=Seongchinamella sediminis TaxID=2283635 RepID=A0A3L7E0F9_9GAMM|nr:hypothetical protein [Seongchinamella sediminis]RLQ21873.1 hypothetical protein DWB85_09800 [Seongchinamella sediminis]